MSALDTSVVNSVLPVIVRSVGSDSHDSMGRIHLFIDCEWIALEFWPSR
jgi:hypothetical protein